MEPSFESSKYPDGRPLREQPQWRRDFPIDVPQDNYVARRDFAKFMILTSGAFMAGQFWILLLNFIRRGRGVAPVRRIASVDEVAAGEVLEFRYPGDDDRCLLIRPDAKTFLAFDQKCTHLACGVRPRIDENQLACPCHKGYFDLRTGRPLAGPPRRPLTRIRLDVRGGEIYAVGREPST